MSSFHMVEWCFYSPAVTPSPFSIHPKQTDLKEKIKDEQHQKWNVTSTFNARFILLNSCTKWTKMSLQNQQITGQ